MRVMSKEARKPTRPQTPSLPSAPDTLPPRESAADELRGRIAKRLAFAGALIAILLGALAVFDYIARPSEEVEAPTFNSPVPVSAPAQKAATQPVTPTELTAPASTAPAAPASTVVQPPAVATASSGTPDAPPAPVVAAQPSAPQAAEETPTRAPAPPVARSPAVAARAEPVANAPVAQPSVQARVVTTTPGNVSPAATPAAAPPLEAVRPAATLPRLPSGYALQAGVFTSTQRAEEVHAMLTLNGIPSTLETRVQVGPFATRAEAELARQKLKALGIDAMLLMPPERRR
jgi:DedD protein